MAVTLKRQVTDEEKALVLKQHGRVCFASGHAIADEDPIHFDHIRAFTIGGVSETDNIAPMCEAHNLAKGQLPLHDYRVKLRLQEFFARGDALTLKHLLEYLRDSGDIGTFGQPLITEEKADQVVAETTKGRSTHTLYVCPATKWKYFYATLPVDVLDSDDDDDDDEHHGLQPRYLIFDRVFDLFRHFERHPVLLPSIGRLHKGRVVLFDGQHKIAGLLWTGRREFECKVYLTADLDLLNQTNIHAHDKYSQVRFYSSIMVSKLGSQFGTEFEKYRALEDDVVKSEAGFMRYLERSGAVQETRAERNKRFRSYLYNSVLDAPENRLTQLVSKSNRSTDEKPLTVDGLTKSIFACFMYADPVEDDMATTAYRREREVNLIILLMNVLFDSGLKQWNPAAGPNDDNQRRLDRMFRSKSMMAWAELLRDAVCGKLDLQDAEDRARPFYRDLTGSQEDGVRKVIARLFSWKGWMAPGGSEIERTLSDNKSAVKEWFKAKGLTTGYLMGASE